MTDEQADSSGHSQRSPCTECGQWFHPWWCSENSGYAPPLMNDDNRER